MKLMRRWNQRGQNIAEYAILFAVVIAAYAAMQTYAKRSMQARVRSGADAMTGITGSIASKGDSSMTATFNNLGQYEPYYLETFGETYQENVEQQHMGSGKVIAEKVSDVTARAAGSYQKQKQAKGRAGADALWQ